MKIQSKLGRRSLSLACATLLATGAVTLTTQTAVAATQVLGS